MEPVMRIRPSPRAHVAADFLDQVDGARDVGVDDVADVPEILVEEGFAEPVAGIRQKRIHPASSRGCVELVDAVKRREVGLDRLRLHAERAKLLRGLRDLRLVGRDDEVEAVLGANFGELIADAGGGAGDDRERARGCCHVKLSKLDSGRQCNGRKDVSFQATSVSEVLCGRRSRTEVR